MSISSFLTAAESLPVVTVTGNSEVIGSGTYGPGTGQRAKVQGKFEVEGETFEFRLIVKEDGSLYEDSRGRVYLLLMCDDHIGWFYPTERGIGGTFAKRQAEGEPATPRFYVWCKEGTGEVVVYPATTRD